MQKIQQPKQNLSHNYYGRILNGRYSKQLKGHIVACINGFRAFDKVGSPAIPYISAWQENQNIIWYEFVSNRLLTLLGCGYFDAPETFRDSIIERHVYKNKDPNNNLNQEVLNGKEVKGLRSGLREEAKNKGTVEAVYKIHSRDNKTVWLKDQATIESFQSDGITISLGCLTIVTKEMEAEEHLKETQKALRKSEQKFREQAIHDNLTGLYNTRYLYKALSDLIAASSSTGQPFSLVFMDLDNFKQVVDTFGHLNASKTLQEIAATIKTNLRNPAYGVAYGGDEFVLVLPGFKKQQAIDTAEIIRSRIKDTIYLKKLSLNVHVSASFGIATYPDDANTLSELLALADQAMFSVKERGKDSVCGISYKTTKGDNSSANVFSYDCKK